MRQALTGYYKGTAGQFRANMERVRLLYHESWQGPSGEVINWGEDICREDWSTRGSWDVLTRAGPEDFTADGTTVQVQTRRFNRAGIEAFDGPDGTRVEFLDGFMVSNHDDQHEIGRAFDEFARWLASELRLSPTPGRPAPQSERPTPAEVWGYQQPAAAPSPAAEGEQQPAMSPPLRLPTRPKVRERWRAIWLTVKPQVRQGRTYNSIIMWLEQCHQHTNPSLICSRNTLAKIVEAGTAGLLDIVEPTKK
jgi:hypothetical protein